VKQLRHTANVVHATVRPCTAVARVVERDRRRFAQLPGVTAFLRHYVPGEFDEVECDADNIYHCAYVLCRRINGEKYVRIPLTREQATWLRTLVAEREQEHGSARRH
jgi:hypothetical protein